jgi:hypothetical protein
MHEIWKCFVKVYSFCPEWYHYVHRLLVDYNYVSPRQVGTIGGPPLLFIHPSCGLFLHILHNYVFALSQKKHRRNVPSTGDA